MLTLLAHKTYCLGAFFRLRGLISLWEFIMGKAHKPDLLIYLSFRISFPDDNLSKHKWIFTKLGMHIDIVEIWFGIANGQISSNFEGVIFPRHAHIFVAGQ